MQALGFDVLCLYCDLKIMAKNYDGALKAIAKFAKRFPSYFADDDADFSNIESALHTTKWNVIQELNCIHLDLFTDNEQIDVMEVPCENILAAKGKRVSIDEMFLHILAPYLEPLGSIVLCDNSDILGDIWRWEVAIDGDKHKIVHSQAEIIWPLDKQTVIEEEMFYGG